MRHDSWKTALCVLALSVMGLSYGQHAPSNTSSSPHGELEQQPSHLQALSTPRLRHHPHPTNPSGGGRDSEDTHIPDSQVQPGSLGDTTNTVDVSGLRKFPFPFRAMLAISSDADHETLRKFNLIHEFLNTRQMTSMGQGLGLDISDSFFMYNGSNLPEPVDYNNVPISKEFTYFKGTSTVPYGADIINRYIHAGWIDTLHTYGDFSNTKPKDTLFRRKLAVQAIDTLEAANDDLTVWTDHGNRANTDNFGSYGTQAFYDYQQGANPGSPYYHTDLLIPYGVKFVWSDQSSDVFGHDTMIYTIKLPDGQKVWGFYRYTNSAFSNHGTTEWDWTVDDLAQQLSYANLRSIVWKHQYAILAQHFSADNEEMPLPQNAIDALKTLANQYHDGNILVARTSRLLQYNLSSQYLRYYVQHVNGKAVIHIRAIADPNFGTHVPSLDEVRGITFYTSDPQNTEIEIGNSPVPASLIQINPSDGQAPSIEIKWFEPDTKDYAVTQPNVW